MIVDLFAGPGGWDEGLRMVGRHDVVGLEWDDAACRTAKAAGHARIRCDVAQYPTAAFRLCIKGLIASPPCTLFSSAGTGVGRLVLDVLARGIVDMLNGNDTREAVREAIYPVTLAQAEVKNAKRAAEKRWTSEQVAAKARQDAFVASLVIEPARYINDLHPEWVALEQVPEVLPLWHVYVRELRRLGYSAWTGVLNSADYGVPQTRQRAILMASRTMAVQPPEPTHAQSPQRGADLFGSELQPWVCMAAALDWDEDDRLDHPRGAGMIERHGPRDDRAGFEPAMTVTSKGRSWLRMGNQTNAAVRNVEQPAPTVLFGHRSNAVEWFHTRPATTVVGSFNPDVISPPGYRLTESRQNAEGGVRVTVTEAGVLQSFRADYPWHGSRSKQYEQVGNAIPPRLSAHVLAALGVGELALERAA